MSENSKIEWTHHTFNPWWGCAKVSEACRNCYAESLAKRYGKEDLWKGNRNRTKGPWKDILKWDKSARERGVRERVFVASMSDIFEIHYDSDAEVEMSYWRDEAFALLENLTNLDVLLLTKRPQFAKDYLINRYGDCVGPHGVPDHFWVGTTVENQRAADERLPILSTIPAKVRFLSCEPLLEPVDLKSALSAIDWVIVGGESGSGCRPMQEEWATSIKEQCDLSGTSFFFKQGSQNNWPKFKDFESYPEGLKVREFPIIFADKIYKIRKIHSSLSAYGNRE